MLIGAGVAGAAAFAWWMFSDEPKGDAVSAGGSYGMGPTLNGKIVPGSAGSPAGPLIPHPGYASREDYEWGYIVGPGDNVEGIAQAITGDEGRYQELLLANPQLKMIGEAGVYLGDKSWGVAPGQIVVGEGLLLPLPWSRYVDQVGRARGTTTPFARDPRASTDVLVSGVGDRPYDRPMALEAA
jgi:hypothetical protein